MADNLLVKDGQFNSVAIRTTEEDGVHTPYHKVRLLDMSGDFYTPANALPVTLLSSVNTPVTIEAGAIELSARADSDSVSLWGQTILGAPKAVRTSESGRLSLSVLSIPNIPPIGSTFNLAANPTGQVFLGLQVGDSPVSQVAANNRVAPLLLDSTGKLWVAFDFSGNFDLPFTEKGDLLTYDGLQPFVLSAAEDRSILIIDSASDGGLRWLSPGTDSSPYQFLRSDLSWVPIPGLVTFNGVLHGGFADTVYGGSGINCGGAG